MADKTFPKGIRIFAPRDGAPDFVMGGMVITLNELVQFCKDNPNLLTEYKGEKQLKCQLLESKEGKPYAVVDEYKGKSSSSGSQSNDDLPF